MKRALLVGAIAIIVSSAGHAQQPMRLSVLMTTLEKQGVENRGVLFDQVAGAGRGFALVNGHLKLKKAPVFYCQPENLALVGKNYVDIAVQEYRRNLSLYDDQSADYSPVDAAVAILLEGLRQTFPCK